MWRLLSDSFGVLEARDATTARRWLQDRPDIDALIVEDELPDARGGDLVKELATHEHRAARRAIIVASEWRRVMLGGMNVVERGDMAAVLEQLGGWFGSVARLARATPYAARLTRAS